MAPISRKNVHWAQAAEIAEQIETLQKKLDTLLRADDPKPQQLQVFLPQLHAESGRLDARRIAFFINIPLKRLSEGLRLRYGTVHRSTSAESLQYSLQPVKRILEILYQFFGDRKAIRAWLRTSHPDLGGKTALEMILENKTSAVQTILENALAGVPS